MKFKGLNIIIILLLGLNINVKTQESHFSQVSKIPLLNNPANAGVMDYELRVTNNYRNQWKKINIPYNTIHVGLDRKIRFYKQTFGISIDVLNDLSKSNIIATNAFSLALSYSRFYKIHQFVAGIQVGKVFKSYDSHNITFGSQFDPNAEIFNSNIPSGENDLIVDLDYNDINAGILWRSKLKIFRPLAGFSIHHINKPVVSFINDENDERLSWKYTIHGNVLVPLISKYDITPSFYYSFLSGSHELISGATLGYNPEDFMISINRLYGMAMFRINPTKNIDAMIIGGGIDFYNFDLGISYDFNISSLRKVTNFRGAFEISLIFMGGRQRTKGSSEPCYML